MAPITGVLMSVPMALTMKATLDEAVAKVDEEKRFCKERLAIQQQASVKKLEASEQSAHRREILLQGALTEERNKSLQASQQAEAQSTERWLWGASGAGIGLLVGAVAATSVIAYLYITTPTTPQ